MTYLTRRERDALVVVLTTLATVFLAGFITGVTGFETTTAAEYRSALFLFFAVAVIYLLGRALVRIARVFRDRFEEARQA